MTDLIFDARQAKDAIALTKANGRDWLYRNYPKPGGQMRKSSTGFLMYEGVPYPVKPLGRLANEIAGVSMTTNPITNVFRRHFEKLGFQLIESAEDEAQIAVARQRRLAEAWARPEQAKFRKEVFALFGARCLVTGCETLAALEAAHVLPVAANGWDEGWNGIPLRADIHRLFDAGMMKIDPRAWRVIIAHPINNDYLDFCNLDISTTILKSGVAHRLALALKKRADQPA